MKSYLARHLDPGSVMGEILFGLIMTLTFTLGASLVIEEEGREGARAMLIGIVGCNIAWGLIDGVLYVLGIMFERGRMRRVGFSVREAGSPEQARALVAKELDDYLVPVTEPGEREGLYSSIVSRLKQSPPAPNKLQREDWLGGLGACWLVIACSIPAVIPFLLIDDLHRALRVSNGILLALLFLVGYRHAKHTTAQPLLTGLIFLLVGVFLVALTIRLGG
jgi:hypothetical protein